MLPGVGRESNSENSDNSDNSDEDNDEDDRISNISGLSDLSGSDWKPNAGPFTWVQRQMLSGADPRTLLQVHSLYFKTQPVELQTTVLIYSYFV
jgi:NAD-dependent deacetylase sirtuin 1